MAGATESVYRADAVAIRPESLAAHAPGVLDVDRLADGWKHGTSTYPSAAHRKAPPDPGAGRFKVPASDRGRRNLALLPGAKANASSVFADGAMRIHQVAHLNDGWYGNQASWIAKTPAAWAEIDLGHVYAVSQVRLSNDEIKEFSDRRPVSYRILLATKYAADSAAATWKPVAEVSGEPLLGVRDFSFAPCDARWVRVQILKSRPNEPRLDEIQIFEARPLAEKDLPAWELQARRSANSPKAVIGGSTICLGSKAYLDEAARRLLENCADGVAYVMFDGNWYQGGCDDPAHGHPVPFTKEDHMRANLELRPANPPKVSARADRNARHADGRDIRPATRRYITSTDCPAVTT